MILPIKSSSGNSYIYDPFTNQILRVEEPCLPESIPKLKNIDKITINEFGINSKNVIRFSFEKTNEIKRNLDKKIKTLILGITEDCNNRCHYCVYSGKYHYERKHKNSYMSKAISEKAIDYFIKHSTESDMRSVSFYGGEPTLNWDVIDHVINYLHKIKISVNYNITTNGVGISSYKIDTLLKNNFNLAISLDGPIRVHNRNRKSITGNGTWEKVTNTLKYIKNKNKDYYRNKVMILITMSPPYDIQKVKSYFECDELIKDNLLILNFVNPHDNDLLHGLPLERKVSIKKHFYDGYRLIKEEFIYAAINNNAIKHFGRLFFDEGLRSIHNRIMFDGSSHHPNGICIPGSHRLFVNTEGYLYPCEKCGDFMPLGNIDTGIDIKKSIKYIKNYIKSSEMACKECKIIRFCDLCFISGRIGRKFNIKRKNKNCQYKIDYIKDCLDIYVSVLEIFPTAFDYLSLPLVVDERKNFYYIFPAES